MSNVSLIDGHVDEAPRDMRVKDLKHIINNLPDDMLIVIPVIDEDNANHILGFRKVRTAGLLNDEYEREGDRDVLCLNSAADGQNIADQVHFSGRDVGVKEILFGTSPFAWCDFSTTYKEEAE